MFDLGVYGGAHALSGGHEITRWNSAIWTGPGARCRRAGEMLLGATCSANVAASRALPNATSQRPEACAAIPGV